MRKRQTDIESLLEAYFDGTTSLKEEQFLRDFFRKGRLPETLGVYRPIFCYLAAGRRENRRRTLLPLLRKNARTWSAAAAVLLACTTLPLAVYLHGTAGEKTSRVFIGGKKYTNIELVRSEALKSLEHLAEGNASALSSQVETLELFR
ncbi:MAG: hypothetical protein LBJ01_07580 [Tannerella sp.]|jgi:hypothetical protein|nr:hypothetical protein [Tannerella sp.]